MATDKPVYLPGQEVKYRIVGLDRNARPLSNGENDNLITKITVEDTEGSVVYKLENAALNKFGQFQASYKITNEPILGTYKIKMQTSQGHYEVEFKAGLVTF